MQQENAVKASTPRWDEGEYGRSEEFANALTHGVGALLSISGLIVLVILSATEPEPVRIISALVYGSSLTLLFLISTLYHSPQPPRLKRLFQILDHCAIYLLIAGTYTPFLLISMKGVWGYTLMAVVWGMALSGIIFKALFQDRFEVLSLITYIAMGWLAIVAITEVVTKIPTTALILVIIGGLSYMVGILFYAMERIPYNHAIWHVFALGGSIFHFFAVYRVVVPPAV